MIDSLRTRRPRPGHPTVALALPRRSAAATSMATAIAMSFGLPAYAQVTLPTGPTVVSGGITVGGAGNTLTVNQSTQSGVINWLGFSIGAGGTVNFVQPNGSAITLNRVTSNAVSQIDGALNANGRVFLVNANGVLFSGTAQVDTGGLVASTMTITDADFNAGVASGRFRFSQDPAAVNRGVVNQGRIIVRNGGTAALLGDATNTGSVTADGGYAALGNGTDAVLDFNGDGLTRLIVSNSTLNRAYGVANSGTLQADGGTVLMEGAGRTSYGDLVVNQTGTVQARTVNNVGGRIFLSATAGNVAASGTLDASATAAGDAGGRIVIDGDAVTVGYTATTINAGGAGGGANGSVAIGANTDLLITGAASVPNPSYGGGTFSYIADSALASALGNGTNATLASRAGASGYGGNVSFNNANVSPTQTRDASLRVDAQRNISISGSTIRANGAAIAIDLDANSTGTAAGRGTIQIANSTLASNGGSIRLFGQNDAAKGRAVAGDGSASSGITVSGSTLDTRTATGGGAGALLLRGTGSAPAGFYGGGSGVAISGGSALRTAAGAITIDGIGGIGGAGVAITGTAGSPAAGPTVLTTLSTVSGDVSITGVSSSQTDPTVTYQNANPVGVSLSYANVAGGGNVTIAGTGANLSPSVANIEAAGASGALAAGDGVQLAAAAVSAGAGRQLAITGTAGSVGVNHPAGSVAFTETPAAGIRQTGDTGQFATNAGGVAMGLRAAGGTINLVSGNGDIAMAVGASAANTAGAGGSILIDGQTVHLLGSNTAGPVFDSSGSTTNGTLTVRSAANLAVVSQASTSAQSTNDGNSYVTDAALNSALDTSRTVNVGSTTGQINVGSNVALLRSRGTAPSALNFTAARAFFGGVDPSGAAATWSVKSTAGALDVNITAQSSALLQNATVNTNGGSVAITSVNSSDRGVDIDASTLDTRVGQSAANASGSITVTGTGQQTGIETAGAQLLTSTGDITLSGHALNGGEGVGLGYDIPAIAVAAPVAVPTRLQSGSGNIRITGIAENGAAATLSNGVLIGGATVTSATGRVDIAGYSSGQAAPAGSIAPSAGVAITGITGLPGGTLAATVSGGAGVGLAGTATRSGPGVYLGSNSSVASNGAVVLRAQTGDAASTAMQLTGTSQVSAGSLIDLHPGGVTAAGTVVDDTAAAITVGTGTGYVIGTDTFTHLSAPTIAIGSSTQTGAITINAPLNLAGNLTLQNAAGGIALNGAVNVGNNTLALLSGGDITQTAALTARSLLAISTAGAVNLGNAGNTIQPNTLAGSAANGFTYVNAGALGIGTVGASTYNGASNAVAGQSASGVTAGGAVLLRTVSGDFTLNAPVSGSTVDLVSAGRFFNPSASAITASNGWRVWADTYVGENRGGLAGNGPLPNLYGCVFGGPCGVTVPTSGNHFVYRQQPTLTVTIDNASRVYGEANPVFTYATGGLLGNGDTLAGALSGSLSTLATMLSNVGNYAINNNFTSPAGYQLAINPAALAITPATLTYVANPASREYGLANPLFGGTVTGFVNGDTVASATTGTLAWTSPATIGSNVGLYAINGGGLSAGNYVFTQAAGNATAFAVTPATLTYVANPFSREYGLANPAFGGTVTGFRNGDTLGSATTGTLAWTSLATIGSNVGRYAVTGSGLAAANYVFAQAAGNANALVVTPATLTYVASPFSREYGLANPLFGGSVTGFRNGDTLASATTGSLAWTSPATIGSNVGNYAINGGGLVAGNYVFTQAAGNATALSITPATLFYVADPLNRPVGSPNPALGGTVTGFRNGDTQQSATTGTLIFTTSADRDSPVGRYGIFGSGLSALNYRLVQAPSNATILAVTEVPVDVQVGVDYLRELPMTYLYDRNLGVAPSCPVSATQDAETISASNDNLTREWSLVRVRPNLSSCVQKQKKNSCSADF